MTTETVTPPTPRPSAVTAESRAAMVVIDIWAQGDASRQNATKLIAAAIVEAERAAARAAESAQMERDVKAECNFCGNPHWSPAEYDEQKGHFYHMNEKAAEHGWPPDVCQADRMRRAERQAAATHPRPAAGGE